jgi:hypothetical protein
MTAHPGLWILFTGPLLVAETLTVGLVAYTPGGMNAIVWEELQTETGRLLAVPGLRLVWRTQRTVTNDESFDRTVVIRFIGSCAPTVCPRPVAVGPLGFTPLCDGVLLPFIEVHCGRAAEAIAAARRFPETANPYLFGRALARITAHELYHVLSQSRDHDREGLSQARIHPADLCQASFDFCPEALKRIAERLFPAAPAVIEATK